MPGRRRPGRPRGHRLIVEQAIIAAGWHPGYVAGESPRRSDRVIAEFAVTASLRPLLHPGDAPPETVHAAKCVRPTRSRPGPDCRCPGRDKPAVRCDFDHTIAYHGWVDDVRLATSIACADSGDSIACSIDDGRCLPSHLRPSRRGQDGLSDDLIAFLFDGTRTVSLATSPQTADRRRTVWFIVDRISLSSTRQIRSPWSWR